MGVRAAGWRQKKAATHKRNGLKFFLCGINVSAYP